MKDLMGTMLILLCVSVPVLVVDSACAQEAATAKPDVARQDAKTGEAKPAVPQKKSVPQKPAQSIFRKLNRLFKNLAGKALSSSRTAATTASAEKFSAALAGYLERQIR